MGPELSNNSICDFYVTILYVIFTNIVWQFAHMINFTETNIQEIDSSIATLAFTLYSLVKRSSKRSHFWQIPYLFWLNLANYQISIVKLTCMLSFTVVSCLIGSIVGRCHLFGSQMTVLLKAKPDSSAWNLRDRFSTSATCHPITWELLQSGPSKNILSVLSTNLATVQIPIRLHKKKCPVKSPHKHNFDANTYIGKGEAGKNGISS